jgi:hypothetical protein
MKAALGTVPGISFPDYRGNRAISMHERTSADLKSDRRSKLALQAGLAFLFVPINTISYTDMPREASNQVSGLINLMRNMGGSMRIYRR